MRYSNETVQSVLSELESGCSVRDVCTKHGISPATVHRWRAEAREHRRATSHMSHAALVDENRRLKQLVGELTLENRELKGGSQT